MRGLSSILMYMRRKLLLLFLALSVVVLVFTVVLLTTRRPGKQTASTPTPATRFFCPVSKQYCKTGKVVTLEGQYAGVGYALPVGAGLFAVFGGGLRPGWAVSSASREPLIILENKKLKLEAVYRITGQSFTRYDVARQGEKIAEAQEARLVGSGFNIVIYLRRTDAKSKPVMLIQPADFTTL
ncbi:MAG: hypothetical protein IPM84_09755 [Anaerolineae bacterium]|nr:hypothetical protein [Anaerolineae bacterium]